MDDLVAASLRPGRSIQITPVILSGGAGTRLWPLSRAAFPKQFLRLTSERTLFQEAVMRAKDDAGFAAPIVICNHEHRFIIDDQLAAIGVKPQQIFLEPMPRDTAPAIAIAAIWLAEEDPEALMLVQPTDHVIRSVGKFLEAVARGTSATRSGKLVTFGVKPTRAEAGYGYIELGKEFDRHAGAWSVDRFVEKPEVATARSFMESGAFCWNSGIFLFAVRDFLDELERLHPTMLKACRDALRGATRDMGFVRLAPEAFASTPALSIDRAVMEHTDRGAVVPVDMEWSDISEWQSLREANAQDAAGNVVQGDAILENVRNSYIRSEAGLVAAVGLEDTIVVSTDDAVFVAKASEASDVAGIVEYLRGRNRPEPLQHTTCHRPWGSYKTVDKGDRFQVKRIIVKPGAKLSLQRHYHRAEHWVVVSGTALVRRGAETMLLHENESTYIPIGTEHRLENPGKLPLHLIEVQSGAYLGEDDIVRVEDTYGRA